MRESGVETNSSAAEKGSEARIVSVAARETTSRADRGSQEKTEQLAAVFARQPEPVVCERPERSRETEPPPSGKPSTYSMPAVGARGSLVHPADTEPPAKTAPETTVGINRHAPTTGERKSGELEAERERMMVEHLPIVRFLARRIHERLPQHVDMEDLVSAGVLGLMDALSKFDPEKKVQFRSYAQFRIRGAILDSLRTLDWSPRDLRRKGRAVEEAIRLLTARHGRPATEFEVAEEMHLPLAAYQQLLGELKGLEIGTLHMERSEDSGEEELAYIPNRPEDDPLFRCLRGEMRQRLADAIAELAERERLVMTLYYYEEMTMKEIGLTLGVVESRVSQIHASAVLHLRVLLSDLALRKGEGKPAARVREETRTPAASRQQRRI
jgi:RNA polymerase sigma factor for flagellar operon FliA